MGRKNTIDKVIGDAGGQLATNLVIGAVTSIAGAVWQKITNSDKKRASELTKLVKMGDIDPADLATAYDLERSKSKRKIIAKAMSDLGYVPTTDRNDRANQIGEMRKQVKRTRKASFINKWRPKHGHDE